MLWWIFEACYFVNTDGKRKQPASQPPSLPDISRAYGAPTIKILDVTISSRLSVSDHVTNLISKCSQTLYALTIRRAHGLCDVVLQSVWTVIIARLLYASVPGGMVWFTTSSEYSSLHTVHRGVRRGFCPPDLLNNDELVPSMDDKLFNCNASDEHHVLHQFLPPERPDWILTQTTKT